MTDKTKASPPCPTCGEPSIRWGKKVTRKGLVQRYQCAKGHLFLEPEVRP